MAKNRNWTDEDLWTSTVDGAAAFERGRSKFTRMDFEDEDEPNIEIDEDEYDPDYCGCSDPGCPCGGYKRGGSP